MWPASRARNTVYAAARQHRTVRLNKLLPVCAGDNPRLYQKLPHIPLRVATRRTVAAGHSPPGGAADWVLPSTHQLQVCFLDCVLVRLGVSWC